MNTEPRRATDESNKHKFSAVKENHDKDDSVNQHHLNPSAAAFRPNGKADARSCSEDPVNHRLNRREPARNRQNKPASTASGGTAPARSSETSTLSSQIQGLKNEQGRTPDVSSHTGSDRNRRSNSSNNIVSKDHDRPKGNKGRGSNNANQGSQFGRSPRNANYLLGFRYEHQPTHQHATAGGWKGSGNGQKGRNTAGGRRRFRKESFLQANFRFVVSDSVQVQKHMERADEMFDWEDVLQVEVTTKEPLQCPVTLEAPPLVPVITACGHIFSLPAIVHCMLDAGGEHLSCAASCPLCYRPISARDLRLVTSHTLTPATPNTAVPFVLLRRPRSSVLPYLAAPSTLPCPPSRDPADPLRAEPFAKFVLAADPLPAFRRAATALAHHAAAVLAGGGLEAEMEGPALFKSMDVLAGLGRAWRRRKAELLADVGVVGGELAGGGEDTEAAARDVEQAIRDVFTLEMKEERVRSSQEEEAAQRQKEERERSAAQSAKFPSLAGAAGEAESGERSVSGLGSSPPAARGVWSRGPAAQASASPGESRRRESNEVGGDLFFVMEDSESPPPWTPAIGRCSDEMGGSESPNDCYPGENSDHISSAALSPPVGSLEDPVELLGRSPSQDVSVNQTSEGDFYMYQAMDGQSLFLHPVNVRALLNHYSSFNACPPKLTARIVEIESMSQTEAIRRRLNALAHLPLSAEFRICEVDLAPLLPPEALEPFQGELEVRAKRRARATARAKREAEAARVAEEAEAAAKRRPCSLVELGPMPLPSEVGMTDEELAVNLALQADADMPSGQQMDPPALASSPAGGPSYATLTKLGLAAPTGPPLGSVPPPPSALPKGAWGAGAPSVAPSASAPTAGLQGAWGKGRQGSSVAPPASAAAMNPAAPGTRRNKKGAKVLLLTGGGR